MLLKLLGSKFLMIRKNESDLARRNCSIKDRSRKSRSIQERSLTEFAPELASFRARLISLNSTQKVVIAAYSTLKCPIFLQV